MNPTSHSCGGNRGSCGAADQASGRGPVGGEMVPPFGLPTAAMSPTDETPYPSPELPKRLEGATADTLIGDLDVAAYCARRGLHASEDLKAFLRKRLGPTP